MNDFRQHQKPKVVTLCGSTKFKKQFREAEANLTLKGRIVLSLGFFEQSDHIEVTEEQVQLFEWLHFHKIDMSDEIFVINVDGYIGESTRKEIEYATQRGKRVTYLEPMI
ncbi:hypothetical protein KDJ56_10650 [Brevibacillus composti]|uniref:DUF4406 domain-containing protein n=1 Tax=Brevibacillus composti TaxID=2796470 RepID=A0A7T5EPE3_9BACL|nr:hypothetical protein [Brevibacillus composti]QQE76338.1 hypothetical protein JD108_10965 [Brevibacillus composti]QUO43365.1 hypothetical protein KDJ56_10650 [Brevibacillus composti]